MEICKAEISIACENIRFSSLFAGKSEEKRMFSQAKISRGLKISCKAVVWRRWWTANTTIYSPDSILTHATLIFFFFKNRRDFNGHLLTRIFNRLISCKCSVEEIKKTKLCELHPTRGNSFQNEAVQYWALPVSRLPK